MTRETKIGLLVGLAFIIVIGILLSDHMTASTEPPPAALTQVGANVRTAAATPGGALAQAEAIAPPQQIAPQAPVPTQGEVSPPPAPVQIIAVGPAAGTSAPTQPPQQFDPPVQMMQSAPVDQPIIISSVPSHIEPPITRIPDTSDPIAQAAAQFGEELVTLDGRNATQSPARTGSSNNSGNSGSWSTTLTGMREHKAEEGDSVSKMATRFLGANTKANRDAIIRANPTLQQNPDMVIVGRTYLIPSESQVAQSQQRSSNQAPVARTQNSNENWYTVKPGDSLSKIAVEQLGTASAVAAIKELNKEALKGGETIWPDMKLRLPSRSVASVE